LQDLKGLSSFLHLFILLLQTWLADVVRSVAGSILGFCGDTAHLEVERDKGRIRNTLQDREQLPVESALIDIHGDGRGGA